MEIKHMALLENKVDDTVLQTAPLGIRQDKTALQHIKQMR